MKKFLLLIGLVVLLVFVVNFVWDKPYPGGSIGNETGDNVSTSTPIGDPGVSLTIAVKGEFVCLPHKNAGPDTVTTLECAYGMKSDDGKYYAMDFSNSPNSAFDLPMGRPYTVTGVFTPVEALSTDHWLKYDMIGIIRVDSFKEISTGIPSYPVNSVTVMELNKSVKVGDTLLRITSVYEDSRCPTDVTCFQAGRVIIEMVAIAGTSTVNQRLQPGQHLSTPTLIITLDGVAPEPVSYRKIEDSAYRFYVSTRKK